MSSGFFLICHLLLTGQELFKRYTAKAAIRQNPNFIDYKDNRSEG